MDNKTYIESGILEHYLLGLLSDAEVKSVEEKLAQEPEIRAALRDLEQSLTSYALAQSEPLPEALTRQILDHIDHLEASGAAGTATDSPKGGFSSAWMLYLLLAVLGAALAYFAFKNRQFEQLLNDQVALADSLRNEEAVKAQEIRELEETNQLLRDLRCPPIILNGLGNQPNAIAAVYRNTDLQKNYFEVQTLTPPPSGRQYQLWALVDGVPQDMGVIPIDEDGRLLEFPYVEGAGAFAVTLEQAGGSPTPSLDQMVLYGELG